ncbi:MAG TPA: hypothetical protein VIX17_08895 [Pyrinomonadaceae bacterium]|jgi:hypothetical protein
MIQSIQNEIEFVGFALNDCTVRVNNSAAKYMRVVHRIALELAVPNQFGAEVGGFWLLSDQIEQLRKLPLYYSNSEACLVHNAVEAYLAAQIGELGT